MTESEAEVRWCPFVRMMKTEYPPEANAGVAVCAAVNRRAGHSANNFNCIGSECMAWRWRTERPEETHGYCGLAGKPEAE